MQLQRTLPYKTLFLCPKGWCCVEAPIDETPLLPYDDLIPWIKTHKAVFHFRLSGGEIETTTQPLPKWPWHLFKRAESGLITSFSRPVRYVVAAQMRPVLQALSQQSFYLRKVSLEGLSHMNRLLSQHACDGWLIGFFLIPGGLKLMVVSHKNTPVLERILPHDYESTTEIQRTLQHLKRQGYREGDLHREVIFPAESVSHRRGDITLRILCLAPHQRRYKLYKGLQVMAAGGGIIAAGLAAQFGYFNARQDRKPSVIEAASVVDERPAAAQLSLTLDAIVYKDPATWSIWINGKKYTGDDSASPDFAIQTVTPMDVTLKLSPGESVRLCVRETYPDQRLSH